MCVVPPASVLRVRDGRVLLLWPTPGREEDPFDTRVEDAWLAAVQAKAHARVPVLRGVPAESSACWAGLYEMSPDAHAILGAAPGCANLLLANGSSGHGVMHAPALGHLLAEIILDGQATTVDVTPLRPTRFAEGDPVQPVGRLATVSRGRGRVKTARATDSGETPCRSRSAARRRSAVLSLTSCGLFATQNLKIIPTPIGGGGALRPSPWPRRRRG